MADTRPLAEAFSARLVAVAQSVPGGRMPALRAAVDAGADLVQAEPRWHVPAGNAIAHALVGTGWPVIDGKLLLSRAVPARNLPS